MCKVFWLGAVSAAMAACGGAQEADPDAGAGAGPCGIDTGFVGDEYCIVAPDPQEGFQLHVGPGDYDDPEQVADFQIGPGEEPTECYYLRAPTTEDVFYYRQRFHMRPGSHHLIISEAPDDTPQGWGDCESLGILNSLGGSQDSIMELPPPGGDAPENAGLGTPLSAGQNVRIELHYVNATAEPILREAWLNFYYRDAAEVTDPTAAIGMIMPGIDVPPGTTTTLEDSCAADRPLRVVSLFGHFHAHTTRFSAWRVRDGERMLVYEAFDWAEPGTLSYDSVTDNPEPDAELNISGGHSGLLEMEPGDTLTWECEIANDLDIPLTVGNEVYTAEMCNLFGTYSKSVGGPWGCYGPLNSLMAAPAP